MADKPQWHRLIVDIFDLSNNRAPPPTFPATPPAKKLTSSEFEAGYLFYVELKHSTMQIYKRKTIIAVCSRQVNSSYYQLYQLMAILPTCCYLFMCDIRKAGVESICFKESFISYGTGCGAVCRHLMLVFSTWQMTLSNICYKTATQETEHMTARILKVH